MTSARETRIFLAADETVDHGAVRASLPDGSRTQFATLDEAATRTATLLGSRPFDVVVVACDGFSERALQVITAVAGERPEAPVVVLYSGSPNGFMEAAFEAGADDLITLPETGEQIAFALEKVIARRRGTAAAGAAAPMITVLGPKGGAREDAHGLQPRRGACPAVYACHRGRSRSAIRRRRPRTRAEARPHGVRPRGLRRFDSTAKRWTPSCRCTSPERVRCSLRFDPTRLPRSRCLSCTSCSTFFAAGTTS